MQLRRSRPSLFDFWSRMQLHNLGIVAHVDAGKTTLTERLLFESGALDAPGSVDAGTTRTDSMELERRRGITIRSAVTSFALGDLVVNLVDTPGHPDFIAEVERALGVLDGAVLVVSAVEGVQPQTVVLWRALQALGVPTIAFVNKVDRTGADPGRVAAEIAARLTADAVPFLGGDLPVEVLAERDEALLERWAAGVHVSRKEVDAAVRRQLASAAVLPVLAGSARTGEGVGDLTEAIAAWLPPAADGGCQAGGVVFKIERDDRGKRVYVRMRSGRLTVRRRVELSGRAGERVTAIEVSTPCGFAAVDSAVAGQIAVVRGLESARVGDTFGGGPTPYQHRFPTPVLETVVEPVDPAQRMAMYAALSELAEQDPLIALRPGDATHEVALRLYGEVQKEVIGSLLAEQYGVPVTFAPTSVVCIERLVGTGASVERIGTPGNPYLATVGLRVAPAPPGSGLLFTLDVEAGSMPPAFFRATEEGLRDALRQGLHGWAVPDVQVAMTDSGYYPRQSRMHQKFSKAMSSVAADFRRLTPVVLMDAVRRAGTVVCEPVNRFVLEVPTGCVDAMLSVVGRLGGVPLSTGYGASYSRIEGHLPAGQVRALTSRLPDLTGGEGVFTAELDHHRPVPGPPPDRRRTGPDPLDREVWFREMPR